MKLITYMGDVYRLSDRAYRRMLKAIGKGEEAPTFEELKAKRLGTVACDTTDLDVEGARYYLARDLDA